VPYSAFLQQCKVTGIRELIDFYTGGLKDVELPLKEEDEPNTEFLKTRTNSSLEFSIGKII
jgi:hypothetical protein